MMMEIDESNANKRQDSVRRSFTDFNSISTFSKPTHNSKVIEEIKEATPSIKYGTTKLYEYQKMEVVGKGTYGDVYRCLHLPTNTIVAIKTFRFTVTYIHFNSHDFTVDQEQ
ncbi:MAG: hypothetical protein ACMG6E_08880 [Candidatus Roizmanbacteria bacterium]